MTPSLLGGSWILRFISCLLVFALISLASPMPNTSTTGQSLSLPDPNRIRIFWQAIKRGVEYSQNTQKSKIPRVKYDKASSLACSVSVQGREPLIGDTMLQLLILEAHGLRSVDCVLELIGNDFNPAAPNDTVNYYTASIRSKPLEDGVWKNQGLDFPWDPKSRREGFELSDLYEDRLAPRQLALRAYLALKTGVARKIRDCDFMTLQYEKQKTDPSRPAENQGPLVRIKFVTWGPSGVPQFERVIYDVKTDKMAYQEPSRSLLSLASNSTITEAEAT